MITKEEFSRCFNQILPFSPPGSTKFTQYIKIITSVTLYKSNHFLTFKTRFIEQGIRIIDKTRKTLQ